MRYQRKADVVARSVAGEHVLIPVHGCTTSVYTLNPAACLLWELLAQPQREAELMRALVDRYQIEPEAARRDVAGFLADLTRMGLVLVF